IGDVIGNESLRSVLPSFLQRFWSEQLIITVILSVMSFAFYFFVQVALTPRFLKGAGLIVLLYLGLNAVVIGLGVVHVLANPGLWEGWTTSVRDAPVEWHWSGTAGTVVLIALATFPQLALGLSGFELSMATAPLVEGKPGDDPQHPRARIRRTRLLIVVAAL